jgi:uncharacterized protein YbaP (TraB family)
MMFTRVLFATTAFLGFAGLALAAEPPECVGKSMLPDLAVSAPEFSARLASAEQTIANGQAILWRITDAKGTVAPSHLFGTIHLTDASVNDLSPEARRAIESASVVALEVKEAVDPSEEAQAIHRNARFMAMLPGTDMWDLIPDADEDLIRSAPQIPPERMATLGSLQPWVIAVMLASPPCENERQRAGLPVLDQTIGKMAVAWLTPLVGLETIEEQLAALSEAPLETQARFLVAQARSNNQLLDLIETSKQLYLGRKLSSLLVLTTQGLPTDEPDPAMITYLTENLINKRNKVMLERALPLVAKGNAFIAVGAAHLPGDQGLVELFRKAGYEVTPIN